MLKKVLSGIIAGTMLLGSMAMAVSADEVTYEPDCYYVNSTRYDSFTAAHSAVADGGTLIVSGKVEFDVRYGISKNITLQGVNDAKIIPTDGFKDNTEDTNKKGLLNINANVTVNDIAFDGSKFGDTINMSGSGFKDFSVLRIASGTVTLNNVYVTGSPKTLITIGTSSSSADVTANNLKCDGRTDRLPLAVSITTKEYSDIDVTGGTFKLMSGEVNGFIGEDGGTFENHTNNHYTIKNKILWINSSTTSTIKHYSETYAVGKANNIGYASKFKDSITRSDNLAVVGQMTNDAVAMVSTDRPTVEKFRVLLNDAYETSGNAEVKGYVDLLNEALK